MQPHNENENERVVSLSRDASAGHLVDPLIGRQVRSRDVRADSCVLYHLCPMACATVV